LININYLDNIHSYKKYNREILIYKDL